MLSGLSTFTACLNEVVLLPGTLNAGKAVAILKLHLETIRQVEMCSQLRLRREVQGPFAALDSVQRDPLAGSLEAS